MLRLLDLSGLTAARLRAPDVAVEGGMAEPFPVSGNIDPAAFPHLLVDLHNHAATGSLKVSGPTHPKALYFRGGRILFGSSNDPKDQLGSILLESGRITRQQLDEVSAKVGPGRPLAKVLSESGFVNQRELGDAARVKLERILADVLSWHAGSFEFEDGVLPKGAVDLKLSTERLLLSAVRRISDRGFALRHMGLDTVLEPRPGSEAGVDEIRGEVQPLLERLDGRRSLREAIALTRLDEFDAAKTACALLFLGVVRVRPEQAEVDLAEEAQSAFAIAEPEPVTMRVPLSDAEAETFILPPPQPPAFAFPAPAEPEPDPVVAPMPSVVEAEPVPAEPADEEPMIVADASSDLPPEAPTYILHQSPVANVPAPPPLQPVPPAPPTAASAPPPQPVPPARPTAAPAPPPQPVPPARPMAAPAPPPQPVPPARPTAAPASPPPDPELPKTRILRPGEPEPEPPGISSLPELPPPSRPTRPSQEDLAALDALLNPSASAAQAEGGSDLSWGRGQGSGDKTPSPLRGAGRGGKRSARVQAGAGPSTRILLITAALLGIVSATVAAWYFLLRGPQTPSPTPSPTAQATMPPPVSTMPPSTTPPDQASPGPAVATPAPTPIAGPATPPPTVGPRPTPTPAAATRPTPPPRATTAPAAGGATLADARALLARGALSEAAHAFSTALAPGAATRFTVQTLTACSPETVQKAVSGTGGTEQLFVLPVVLQGRNCYRLCWGVYDSRQDAESAAPPAYFRQGGVRPRVSSLADLLP